MATLSLVNMPILPKKLIKMNSISSMTSSPQLSINEEYFTPRSTIQISKTSSDSDSILTDDSSTDDTDYEDFVCVSKVKQVHFNTPPSKPEIHVKLENNEAEFFAHIPSNDLSKSLRKRDRIRAAFRKKFSRSNDSSSDTNSVEWNETLAKRLISLQDDIHEIINDFDQIDDSPSNTSKIILTKPHLSFRARHREKLEMIRIAQMLHPPNLLTCHMKESPYPYTDIIEPHHINLLRLKTGLPDQNLLIQCKPFRYKKFRYRTQRGLLRIKHDLRKIRRDLCGESSTKSHQEAPSVGVLNYQLRLQKTLLEFRKQICEYDRMHASTDDHRPSISQIIANMNTTEIPIEEAYQTKSGLMECVNKNSKNELISIPYIPPRSQNHQITSKEDRPIDKRFDPTTFLDLNKEAEDFFGGGIPFWNKPMEARLSIALPFERKQSIHFTFPPKTNMWNLFIILFKIKQKLMKKLELKRRQHSHDDLFPDEEYFDCLSSSFNRRKSHSLNTVEF